MRQAFAGWWRWYERHYTLNVVLAAALFTLQLVHLVWLGGEVVAQRATGERLFHVGDGFRIALVLIDWTEIPAILSVSLVYVVELRRGFRWRTLLLLLFVNSQYLHIFWITDELVVRDSVGSSSLPGWLAWMAILIDYLELPVIFDTLRKVVRSLRRYGLREVLRGQPPADAKT